MKECIHGKDVKCGCYICEKFEPLSSYAVLGEGWRDVTKELPDIIGNYLIYYCEDWNYDKLKKIAWAFYNSNGEWCLENSKVRATHWMRLPDPPAFA